MVPLSPKRIEQDASQSSLVPAAGRKCGNHLTQWSFFREKLCAVFQRTTEALYFASTDPTYLNSISFYLVSGPVTYKILMQTFQNLKAVTLVAVEMRKYRHRIQWGQ